MPSISLQLLGIFGKSPNDEASGQIEADMDSGEQDSDEDMYSFSD